MRLKTVQFICKQCSAKVFRLGKKIDQERQLCGKCNIKPSKELIKALNILIPDGNQIQNPLSNNTESLDECIVEKENTVLDKIKYYQYTLNKMQDIQSKYPEKSFLELLNFVKSQEN